MNVRLLNLNEHMYQGIMVVANQHRMNALTGGCFHVRGRLNGRGQHRARNACSGCRSDKKMPPVKSFLSGNVVLLGFLEH